MTLTRTCRWCSTVIAVAMSAGVFAADRVEFDRDVRPFLSDTCFKCHGPDAAKRKADLRLDLPEGATAAREHGTPIVAGHPEKSDAYRRLTSTDAEERMPPPKSGLKLTGEQVEIFRRWIEQGAKYEKHWSLVAPRRPPLPGVRDAKWPRNGIDYFILERLEREGLHPASEASKEVLIRRATLDLTGLPPTPGEVDAFLADTSPDAYEKVVDRLLASPHYGERMAGPWLDAARYADTSGYQADWERLMWPWRDWVIDAFNSNKPFDQFTIEQIAGDMLPNATLDQILATGFNRNHRINDEGGIIPEEYAVEYVVDRVDTTSTVFLGLTVQCARCHDHKYDPITQKEFYRLYALFNNVPEKGQDGRPGYAVPFVRIPPPENRDEVAALVHRQAELQRQYEAETPQSLARRYAWEQSAAAQLKSSQPLDHWVPVKITKASDTNGSTLKATGNGVIASGKIPPKAVYELALAANVPTLAAVRLDVLLNTSLNFGPGRADGNFILTEFELEAKQPGAAAPQRLKFKSAYADYSQKNYPPRAAIDGNAKTGWAVDGDTWREEHTIVFVLDSPLRVAKDVTFTVRLRQESERKQQVIGDLKLYASGDPQPLLRGPSKEVVAALKTIDGDPAACTDAQTDDLIAYFREIDPARAALRDQMVSARQEIQFLGKQGVPVMVMQEMPKPRDTYLLKRGQYDQPDKSQKLAPGLPAALTDGGAGTVRNRLDFARWLVSPDNPLTARVAVNRFWQMYFGTGIVKTGENFGSQGEWPSHPELLDWLATEFMARRWDVKAMQKLIVTSATYRQSSRAGRQLIDRDPENRLHARGPRFRLDAFAVRDNALAIAGLLVPGLHGPPVKPYQPPGLWEELAFMNKTTVDSYVQDHGESLYRRSLYTFWKRSAPPPAMMNFDAAGREICSVGESRTNTPLQALTLLNETAFVEAARHMAARMMREGGGTPDERLAYGFRLATARRPGARELNSLAAGYRDYLEKYRADAQAAKALLSVGESPRDKSLDPAEHAAYTAVANVILNLDETVTKE